MTFSVEPNGFHRIDIRLAAEPKQSIDHRPHAGKGGALDAITKLLSLPADLLSKVPGIGPIVTSFRTTVGQKVLMAITGLSLVGFLVVHLGGNFQLFLGEEAFNGYAEKLHSLGPLLWAAETGLLGIFLLHLGLAISTAAVSRQARQAAYEKKETKQAGFVLPNGGASGWMLPTGIALAVYMLVHIMDMKFDVRGFGEENKYALVKAVLSDPKTGVFYLISLVLLGIHLHHGIGSAFQTLGLNNRKWRKLISIAGTALAVLLSAGYISIVIWASASR